METSMRVQQTGEPVLPFDCGLVATFLKDENRCIGLIMDGGARSAKGLSRHSDPPFKY